MPYQASGILCSRRYTSYPRPGSIYRKLDDPRLIRGPTLVKMRTGRDMKVPANFRKDMRSQAQSHDMASNKGVMEQLAAMLQGRKPEGPEPQKGFGLQMPGFARPMPGRGQNMPRHGGIAGGGGMHGQF